MIVAHDICFWERALRLSGVAIIPANGFRALLANGPAIPWRNDQSMKTRSCSLARSQRDYPSKVTIRRKMASLRICWQRRLLRRGGSLSEPLNGLYKRVGKVEVAKNWRAAHAAIDGRARHKISPRPPTQSTAVASRARIEAMELNLSLRMSWLLMGSSRLEPLVRSYVES
jgi:hypothetical protein